MHSHMLAITHHIFLILEQTVGSPLFFLTPISQTVCLFQKATQWVPTLFIPDWGSQPQLATVLRAPKHNGSVTDKCALLLYFLYQ